MIRSNIAGSPAKVDALTARGSDLPRRADAQTPGVQQNGQHHPRVVGRTAFPTVGRVEPGQIKLPNAVMDEADQVAFLHPVVDGGRQQKRTGHD